MISDNNHHHQHW